MSKIDRIRRVRSFSEVNSVIEEIRKESSPHFRKPMVATAARRGGGDEEIVFQHGEATRVRRAPGKTRSSSGAFPTQIKNFKAPAKGVVNKNSDVVAKLYENVKELDALEAVLIQTYGSMKAQPAALKAVRSLKKEVDTAINDSLSNLNSVAVKHFPAEMVDMRDHLTSFLIDNIPSKQYDNIGFLEYITMGEKGSTLFSIYVEIDQLRNSRGYVFSEYFIILTGVVDVKGNVSYYVNALPDFRVPGKYPLGKQVTSERHMDQQVSNLLAHNNVITDLDRAPMPFDNSDVAGKGFSKIAGVKSASVSDDALYLETGTISAAKQQTIAKQTIAALNETMRRRKDANISWKPVTKGGKSYLKFILYFKPGAAPQNLNLEKFDQISSIFELNDKQKRELRRSLLD